MRKLFTILVAVLLMASVFSQVPQKMSYQAVIRNNSDALVTNTQIEMQITILQGSISGMEVYVETQTSTTNSNGLVSIEIGNGTVESGDFTTINWANGPYFIKTETAVEAPLTTYTITSISQLLSVPYALHAKTAETVTGSPYSVGDFAQGGIVFWVDETGQHGLVAAKEDNSIGERWHAGTSGNTQAKGDGPFAGEANTSIIIAAHVAIGDDGNTYAARVCNELQVTEGGKTYGDWYLPSKEELNLMYQNRAIIDATAGANGGSGFTIYFYWSSTEYSSGTAWGQGFGFGTQFYEGNGNVGRVRAIRAF